MADEKNTDSPKTSVATETQLPWLGTTKFWIFAGAIAVAIFMAFWISNQRLTSEGALVPVVTLSGPTEVIKGETVRYAVLVRDRRGAPIPNAKVRIGFWKTDLIEVGRGVTGDGGDASIDVHFPQDFEQQRSLVAVAEVGVADGADNILVEPRNPSRGSMFVSTDKPLYQPGQTVHIRGLAMTAEPKPIPDKPSVIVIRTADGTKVFRAEKPTSAFGVVSTDFVLADQVKLGTYSISIDTTVTPPREGKDGSKSDAVVVHAHQTFEVKRYSLPKLKVALDDVATAFATDGPLKGSARATWIFGEPVTKGEMKVTLERAPSTIVTRFATGNVDKDGVFRFELLPQKGVKPEVLPSGTFTLRAKIELEGGMRAEATKTVATLGTTGAMKLEVFPESGALVAGVKQNVHVVATAEDREGITIRTAEKDGPTATTSARGIATLSVEPLPWGKPLEIIGHGKDGSEGKLDVQTTQEALVVRPDLDSYKAGGTMQITVLGANKGDHISLRVTKGSEPIATGTCGVTDPRAGCTSSIVLPSTTSGLAWVHALSLPSVADQWGQRRIKIGKRLVVVGGGSRDLDLRVTPDKKSYEPRQMGLIDVAVTGVGGAPIKAQLGVAVADEAVFALANVRPDLEKIFFTVDKDVEAARGYYGNVNSSYSRYHGGSSSSSSSNRNRSSSDTGMSRQPERSVPSPYQASDAYDGETPPDVKGVILAALTSMPESGGFQNATVGSVSDRANDAVKTQQAKLHGWAIIVLSAVAILAFLAFCIYGVSRFRRPIFLGALPSTPDAAPSRTDLGVLKLETRGLMLDWFIAVLGPPFVGMVSLGATELVARSGNGDNAFGTWLVAGVFCALLLVRAVLRVRRVFAKEEMTTLKRALFFLPIACFVAHLAIVLVLTDRGTRIGLITGGSREDALFLPALICGAAQIAFGFLGLVRQTMLRETTRRQRFWTVFNRAALLGLPGTLICLGLLTVVHIARVRRIDWTDYTIGQLEAEQVPEESADNKEGGSGTRAKGEEGSMGNPNTRDSAKRYGVRGPSDNDEKKPGGKDGLIAVRDYFPETLMWAPEVTTDDKGLAQIKVPFADSITTWRFGLKGVSSTGQLGSTTVPLVVKQDFFVEASFPPVLTQGDEIAVPVTVFSYTADPQDVTLDLEGDGISVVGGRAQTALHLGPREARGFRFSIKADKAGERIVKLKAVSSARGDAIERKITVTPNGLAVPQTINGRLTGSALQQIDLPKNAIDGGNDLYVKIYGGPLSQVAEGLDGVFHMPHGCFEQTSSTTYPSVLALDFLTRSKAVSPEIEKKARAYISEGYQRLISFEVPGSNGGFSLFGKDPASTTLTAYGLMEFSDMSRVASVDEVLIQRSRDYLYGKRTATGGWLKPSPYYSEKDPNKDKDAKDDTLVTAFVAWALAVSTPKPEQDTRLAGVLDTVMRAPVPEGVEPYALALRANALLAGGRPNEARGLLERLAPQAIRGEDGVHFTSKAVGVMYSYGSSMDVEVTGLATHAFALAKMEPELRAGALDWIVARRSPYGTWSTTQATIAAMRALLDEAKPAPKDPQDITVLVDGESVETYKMLPAARDVHHLVGLRRFATTGQHVVELRATGTGDVSYQIVGLHYLPWQRPNAAGLSLDVSYTPAAVQAGTTTTCRVRLGWRGKDKDNKEPARMPLIEIGIPPAFEVESDDLEALLKDASAGNKTGVQRYTVDRGKVTLYLGALAEDKPLSVDLRLRALRPARVIVPASTAYLYYEPEVRTETQPVLIRSQ